MSGEIVTPCATPMLLIKKGEKKKRKLKERK